MNITEVSQKITGDLKLTTKGLQVISAASIRQRFPDEQMTGVFVKKVLRCIKTHTDNLQDEVDLKDVKKLFKDMKKRFPVAELKMHRKSGRRFISIALDGFVKDEDDE